MIGHISWPVICHNRWPVSDEQCNFDPLLFCCKIKTRGIQSVGLQVQYKDDEDFAHNVRMLAALAFVPEPDVINAFEDVSEDFPLDAQTVIDYFEDTYIGRLCLGCYRQVPLFELGLWNMYNQTLHDLPRTNNAVEGWHRSFQANVGAYHPNFWKFIDILKREQNLTQVNIAQARAGHQPEPLSQRLNSTRFYFTTEQ